MFKLLMAVLLTLVVTFGPILYGIRILINHNLWGSIFFIVGMGMFALICPMLERILEKMKWSG